jgi:tRNA(fMet)-specific endonuclease VapC
MVKKYLLDTNILIDLYRGNEKIKELFGEIEMEECEICSSVTAEFFQGFHKRRNIEKEKKWYEQLIGQGNMNVLVFDEKIAKKYAEIQIMYLKKGRARPFFDLIIAATAIEHGLILLTSNIKDFEMIEGLEVYRAK